MNELILSLTGAWAIDLDSIERAYRAANCGGTISMAKIEQLQQRVNRVDTFYTMAILASRALVDGASGEPYSLRALAYAISEEKSESYQNKLRDVILPTLTELGWIEPFTRQEPGKRDSHKIVISKAGIEFHAEFLRRCFRESRSILEEVLALPEDESDGG